MRQYILSYILNSLGGSGIGTLMMQNTRRIGGNSPLAREQSGGHSNRLVHRPVNHRWGLSRIGAEAGSVGCGCRLGRGGARWAGSKRVFSAWERHLAVRNVAKRGGTGTSFRRRKISQSPAISSGGFRCSGLVFFRRFTTRDCVSTTALCLVQMGASDWTVNSFTGGAP